jgi:uncharacterized protein GlcG (DUF336 family)
MLLAWTGAFAAAQIDPDAGLAPNTAALTSDDVRAIVTNAAAAVNDPGMVIAVSDRQGNILAVFRKSQAPASSIGNFGNAVDTNELAAAVARTAARETVDRHSRSHQLWRTVHAGRHRC